MVEPSAGDLTARMKADWDARARENARFYIAADDWQSDEAFRASGVRDAAVLLRGLEGFLHARMRALEVGCGIGRLLRPLAPRFVELHGVDVSGEMIRRGREWLADLPNIHLHETGGVDLSLFAAGWFDFVYSYITFQHMPAVAMAGYCREVRRVLAPRGRFRFQVLGFERTDDLSIDPPPDDTFALRSVSDAQLDEMLDEARLEVLGRYEVHAPDGYVPGYRRFRQIWITCERRAVGRRWWRRRRPPPPEVARVGDA